MEPYKVVVNVQIDAEPSRVEAFALGVLDALFDLPDAKDPDLVGTMTLGEVTIEFGVAADDPVDAQVRGLLLLQTALHAFGAVTVGLTPVIQELQTTVRERERQTTDA
jgi:hypothetical protein